jgi:hypothetical protein
MDGQYVRQLENDIDIKQTKRAHSTTQLKIF